MLRFIAIAAGICLWLVTGERASGSSSRSPAVLQVPARRVYLGVSVDQDTGQDLLRNLRAYQHDARKNAALVMYWRDWAGSGMVDPAIMQAIYAQGSVPIISWEPRDWANPGQASGFSLASIIAGRHDSYIRSFAESLKSYPYPIFLRWAHEMNGHWYRWAGNSRQYVAAWRHIHDIFKAEGAANVLWVWSPNVDWDGHHPVAPYYPGNAYVDWDGLDGYNSAAGGWKWFSAIFLQSYREIEQLNRYPIMVAETGSSDASARQAKAGETKPRWIANAYGSAIPSMPRIKAVVWFNENKSSTDDCSCDWRIESSRAATAAFARAVNARRYLPAVPDIRWVGSSVPARISPTVIARTITLTSTTTPSTVPTPAIALSTVPPASPSSDASVPTPELTGWQSRP